MLSRIVVLCSLAFVAGAGEARAQRGNQLWYQAYDAGVRDVRNSAWDSAVQNLLAAKQTGPSPSRRVIFYGDRVDAFNPDYFLGVAYLNLRRFADADAAFERVRQANLIAANDSQFRVFQMQATTAKFELALLQGADFLARGDLAQAKQANDRALALGIDPSRARDQERRLAEAVRIAATPQPSPQASPVPSPQPPPVIAELPSPQPAPVPQPAPPIAQAPLPPVNQAPLPVTVPPVNPPAQSTASNVPVPPRVVDLRTGIAAYLQGRYGDAATLLAPTASDPQGSVRGRFYLACSLAALVLSGERDEVELARAKAVLQLAGRLDQFVADRRVISPRVLVALGMQP